MGFLEGKIKTIYFKYLAAAFGSALITSVYSIFDMAMVGQYHGPLGTASLAVVAPIWNIVYSMGILTGIGGSVLFSIARGRGESTQRANEYFTVSVIGSIVLVMLIWPGITFFDREILSIFGAQDDTLALAREYMKPIKPAIPLFLFNQMLAEYLRNDKNPALATAIGSALSFGVMMTHYQRSFDLSFSSYSRGKCHLVCHAVYGVCSGNLCDP